ncbi:cyclic GMP-AMP synthase isoform X1 [Oncorhynchus keta]|uniref:cyclic GMP-AMP synthase isoform X1 n=1 Tax=Oncorhynchus keta TaxID=8018 RepID=UPI0015FD1F42|nr:cyclic GMP-AMP synthase isoform X1 [Oncorhynchus keta]
MSGRGKTKKSPTGPAQRVQPGLEPGCAKSLVRDKNGSIGGCHAVMDTKDMQQIPEENKPKKHKQPKCTTEGKPTVPPETGSRIVDSHLDKILRTTLDKLKIKMTHKSDSSRIVNDVVNCISDHMKKFTECFKDVNVLRTGSYYEHLKISDPDEFDVMFNFAMERVDIRPFGDDGAFYSVAFKRGKHALDRFQNTDNTVSASEMLKEFRNEVITSVKKRKDVSVEKKKKGCPAVTLMINRTGTVPISLDIVLGLKVKSCWPTFTQEGFKIDTWLGTKVKKELKAQSYYLVPKYEGKGTVELEGVCAKDTWRISFSHVEKSIITNHGSQKTCCEASGIRCCRKDCLKLLKHLLNLLKAEDPRLSKFCTYHAKTTLLHACCSRTKDSDWEATQLGPCFQQLLRDFEGHLKDGKLPNFFIPTHNLLGSGHNHKSCLILAQCIEEQRNNGFPIFG